MEFNSMVLVTMYCNLGSEVAIIIIVYLELPLLI